MSVLLAISPLLVVSLGALLLMLTEAFGKPTTPEGFGPGGLVVDAGAGRASELGLGSAVVLFAGAIASLAVWLVGPEHFEKLDVLLAAVVELADLTGAEVPTLRAIHAVSDLLNENLVRAS